MISSMAKRTLPVLRRAVRAASTSVRDILGAGPTTGVVFHHIPKCAGNSISAYLRSVYPPWTYRNIDSAASAFAVGFLDHDGAVASTEFEHEDWINIHEFRQRLLLTHLKSGTRAVSGHVVYHPLIQDAFAETHKFITVLRNPVDRFASQYLQYLREKQRYHPNVSWSEAGLADVGKAWGRVLTTFLGGSSSASGPPRTDSEMVEKAKSALDRFDIVGFVEDLPRFQKQLADQIGCRAAFGRQNKSLPTEKEMTPMAELGPLIEEFCAPDIAVYEYARSTRAAN